MNFYKNLNEAFVKSLKYVADHGQTVHSRGRSQRESLFYSLCIEDPTALDIDVPARKFNPDYAITEWLWYMSRNPQVDNIGKLANIWLKIQDRNGECESNYGYYLLSEQWQWVKNELINDPDTRRATIVINQPYHKGKNKEDYPCTQYLQFFIRDNELHLGANMRSNDAVFGFCNDVFTFSMFQQLMLNDINAQRKQNATTTKLKLGRYYHTAGSFHVYKTHWAMMDKILNNYYLHKERDGYPDLNKYKLRSTITSAHRKEVCLPSHAMNKDEIKYFVDNIKGVIYV